eukprot:gene20747-27566_t
MPSTPGSRSTPGGSSTPLAGMQRPAKARGLELSEVLGLQQKEHQSVRRLSSNTSLPVTADTFKPSSSVNPLDPKAAPPPGGGPAAAMPMKDIDGQSLKPTNDVATDQPKQGIAPSATATGAYPGAGAYDHAGDTPAEGPAPDSLEASAHRDASNKMGTYIPIAFSKQTRVALDLSLGAVPRTDLASCPGAAQGATENVPRGPATENVPRGPSVSAAASREPGAPHGAPLVGQKRRHEEDAPFPAGDFDDLDGDGQQAMNSTVVENRYSDFQYQGEGDEEGEEGEVGGGMG